MRSQTISIYIQSYFMALPDSRPNLVFSPLFSIFLLHVSALAVSYTAHCYVCVYTLMFMHCFLLFSQFSRFIPFHKSQTSRHSCFTPQSICYGVLFDHLILSRRSCVRSLKFLCNSSFDEPRCIDRNAFQFAFIPLLSRTCYASSLGLNDQISLLIQCHFLSGLFSRRLTLLYRWSVL